MSTDPLQSLTSAKDALVGPLYMVTLCTTNLDAIKHFYVSGMKMTLEAPFDITTEDKAKLKKFWDIPESIDFTLYLLHRPEVPSLIKIRLIVLDTDTPHIHNSHDCRELGPFSLGFPNANQINLDKHLHSLGIESMDKMQEGEIPKEDGSTYRYWETIYKGPDFLHCVGIERGDGVPQLSPVDPANNFGGPGYSAFVSNRSDEELAFYTKVLGMELRADRQWETSEGSALGIEPGVPFRFSIVYAKGSTQNHLLFLDYKDGKSIDPGVPPRLPNQGLAMWTLHTKDIGEVLARAHANQIKVYRTPRKINDPIYGETIAMTLLTPSGFIVEVYS